MCHDSEAIKAAVMDKEYMVQLVQVQQRRGALGGQIFSSILTLNEESTTMDVETSAKLTNKIKPSLKGNLFGMLIVFYDCYIKIILFCNILDNSLPKLEKPKKINIDLTLKYLFVSKMESEEFLSFLQVCRIISLIESLVGYFYKKTKNSTKCSTNFNN